MVLEIYTMVGLSQFRPPQPCPARLQQIPACAYLGVSGLDEMCFITFKVTKKIQVNNRTHHNRHQSKQLLVKGKMPRKQANGVVKYKSFDIKPF